MSEKILKQLMSYRIKSVDKAPDFEDCVRCSIDPSRFEEGKEGVFKGLADHMSRKLIVPLEIVRFENTLFIKTRNDVNA